MSRLTKAQRKQNEEASARLRAMGNLARELRKTNPDAPWIDLLREARRQLEDADYLAAPGLVTGKGT